jgi:hypothetical protein
MGGYETAAVAPVERVRFAPATLALSAYVGVAFLYFGLRVVLRGEGSFVGHGVDPQIFVWAFAWWPHALLHGENPFFTHAIWAPAGVNLTWTTSVPGLALAFTPLTLLFGPVAAYNVAATLMPALAAWTCFLLCRHVTGSFWASLAGGYLFGFSSYMLGQQEGHLNLTSVFLIPLIALTIVRRFEDEITSRQLAVRLGVLFVLQLSFSTEVFFSLSLAIGVALIVAYAAAAQLRTRIKAVVVTLAAAYLLVVVIASPFIYFAATGFVSDSISQPRKYTADAVNLVLPTRLTFVDWNGAWRVAERFPGNDSERDAYLGLPVLIAVALFARRRRQLPHARVLLLWLGAAVLAELGAALHVAGYSLVPLPAALVDHLPLLNNVLPSRIAVYVSLITAVMVALLIASSRSAWTRIVLPVVAVIALLPRPGSHSWITVVDQPRFITANLYRHCIAQGETVIAYPFGAAGDSMLWQARTDFWFRLAGGYMRPDVPASVTRFRAVHPQLDTTTTASDVYRYAHATGSRVVIVDLRHPVPWQSVLGGAPARVGNVLVYRVPGTGHLPRSCH